MQSSDNTNMFLPLPEFGDQLAFKQRTTDSFRTPRRPPKLYLKTHDTSYSRSFNQSIPHAISFRQSIQDLTANDSLACSVYKPDRHESYFEQCFDVLARIGEGSFGEVFKVRSKQDGRLYAIKKSLQLYRGESYRQERIEEVRRYEQFSEHDNCITLHKAWEQNDLLYMQLELCQSNLESYALKYGTLPEAKVWNILIDLLLALKALHDENLIHLDIKLENIMIGEDNVCKLGDFGLVIDLNRSNLHHAMEGDCRYVAPELLQGYFSKAADIFSLGITILELACNLDLPKNGYLWHKLRSGLLPEEFIKLLSKELQNTIKWMMNPDPHKRPDVNTLLATSKIRAILMRRDMMKPFNNIKKISRRLWDYFYTIRIYICNVVTSFTSLLKLSQKKSNSHINLKTSVLSPSVKSTKEPSDDSLLQLDDSDIDFEESPTNRSQNKLFAKSIETHIVNSTPLNHFNNQNSFRRNRSELSRTSLVFDDEEIICSNDHDVSSIKCKKLLELSDDSD